MPLPFPTADRVFDEASADVVQPVAGPDRWRRPYRPGPWRVGIAAVLLLLSSYVLAAAVIIAFAGTVGSATTCAALVLLITVGALRLLRAGTWVSSQGLRHVAFFSTRTLPWGQVHGIRTVQQPVRWLGLPRTVQGQALVLVRPVRQDGPQALLTSHDGDFLGRTEAFERASDTVEAWAAEYGAP